MREMPPTMRQLALVKLFQWYAMFCYWQYISLSIAGTIFGTTDPASTAFRDAGLLDGQVGAGMLAIPVIHSQALLFIPMVGIGLAWASIMGNPYIMLAGSIPPERTGVYMGIFNMFIVIPMIIQIFTLPLVYRSWLGGQPGNVIMLAGALLLCAALAVLRVKVALPTIAKAAPARKDNIHDNRRIRRSPGR